MSYLSRIRLFPLRTRCLLTYIPTAISLHLVYALVVTTLYTLVIRCGSIPISWLLGMAGKKKYLYWTW